MKSHSLSLSHLEPVIISFCDRSVLNLEVWSDSTVLFISLFCTLPPTAWEERPFTNSTMQVEYGIKKYFLYSESRGPDLSRHHRQKQNIPQIIENFSKFRLCPLQIRFHDGNKDCSKNWFLWGSGCCPLTSLFWHLIKEHHFSLPHQYADDSAALIKEH